MKTDHVFYGPDEKGEYGYRDYKITRCIEPVMCAHYDWEFVHVDYDGAPDAHDHRCGFADSLDDARAEIDIIEEAEEDDRIYDELRERGITPKSKRESI